MISILNIALFGFFFVIFWKLVNRKNEGNFPKGPYRLPLLGNVLSFGKLPYVTFNKWANEYGKIYQVFLGNQRKESLTKKAFQHPSLMGRPRFEVLEIDGVARGVIFTSGQEWQEQRRFTLRHLRDFGFGKSTMEELILEEVDELMDWLKSQGSKPISINRKFTLAVLNSLWRILTGKRYSQTDPKLEAIFEQLIMSSRNTNIMLIAFMPRLAKMFPNLSGWNAFRKVWRANKELVDESINQHRAEFTKELQDDPRDFIDAYLGEIDATKDPQSSFYDETGMKSLAAVGFDLFQAGSLTTSTTLTWAVLYMVIHPEVQKKFQQEIDDVIGSSRLPSMADKPRMTYTEALTCEILRKSSLVPMGVLHIATENVSFEGYDIPAGTNISANQYYVHHDPKIWGDPQNFRPERFINSEGKIQLKEFLIPFSTGKRVCLGETLARDELFLFLTCLYQRFEIRADPTKPMPTMDPVPIFDSLEAQEFFITIKDRRD